MKKIKSKNLRTKMPLLSAFLMFTCLHYWQSPLWVYITFGFLYLVVLIMAIHEFIYAEEIDLFEKDGTYQQVVEKIDDLISHKGKFQQRLEEMVKERGVNKK